MKRTLPLILAFSIFGCAAPRDRYHARIYVEGDDDLKAASEGAANAWNAKDERVGLVMSHGGRDEGDMDDDSVVIYVGDVSKPDIMCAETGPAGISINKNAPEACSSFDPATLIAHELGHFMSRRHHSPVEGILMNPHANLVPVEEAITVMDVGFVVDLTGAEVE